MKITWLGQAGLLFEIGNKTVIVDPYLSDSVAKIQPQNYRRQPIDERFLRYQPDIIVITHAHLDHLDAETLRHYLIPEASPLVLAPDGSWQKLRELFPNKANYVLFNTGTTWHEGGVTLRAVKAEHSDPAAIGLILSAEGKNYYITGDTLYNEQVFDSLPDMPIEGLFLPINGVGNNMNIADAQAFATRVRARRTVPMHFGLFDELDATAFDVEGCVVPQIYAAISLN